MKQLFGNPAVQTWKGGPSDWYSEIGDEMQVTWGLLDRFRWELPELRFMRAQTIWLESTLDDLRERRKGILGMARSVIGTSADGELDALWPMISIDTISPRIASAICHAYTNPPVRTFTLGDESSSGIDEGFDSFYEELEINSVMNDAYRAALFTNSVFIYWDGDCFKVLTPEYFRLVEDADGEPELWLCRRDTDGIVFDVWNKAIHTVRKGANGAVISTEANPYEQFPGVMLRLTKSNDTYGAGITECADLNAASNLITLFAMRVALFQGFSVAVATNFGAAIASGQRISPGHVLTPNNVGSDASTIPSFNFVTPEGKFAELQTFREDRINAFQRNQDLPGFLVDAAGVPPTGVALMVAERQINTRRRSHQGALRTCEIKMSKFVQKIAAERGRSKLIVQSFNIKYAAPEMFNDPQTELTYDLNLAQNGAIYPSAFFQKYYGVQKGITDESAIETMMTNKALFAKLTSAAPTTPATNENPA